MKIISNGRIIFDKKIIFIENIIFNEKIIFPVNNNNSKSFFSIHELIFLGNIFISSKK